MLAGKGIGKDGERATDGGDEVRGLQGHKTRVMISLGDHSYLHRSPSDVIHGWQMQYFCGRKTLAMHQSCVV